MARIEANRTSTTSEKLLERARKATSNYVRNIAQSKSFANAIYGGVGLEAARSREYSQNTYMGYMAG